MKETRTTSLRRLHLVLAVIPVCAAGFVIPASASSECDGHWRVAFYIDPGKKAFHKCNREETDHAVEVTDGRFSESNSGYNFRGTFKGCASISFIVTRMGEKARGAGTVTRNAEDGLKADGGWNVEQPSDRDCTGTWMAVRHRAAP